MGLQIWYVIEFSVANSLSLWVGVIISSPDFSTANLNPPACSFTDLVALSHACSSVLISGAMHELLLKLIGDYRLIDLCSSYFLYLFSHDKVIFMLPYSTFSKLDNFHCPIYLSVYSTFQIHHNYNPSKSFRSATYKKTATALTIVKPC